MIDDLKKVLDQVSSPADMAVVLVSGTAGFLVDAGLNAVGFLEPGYVGVTAATGALGMKKSIDAFTARRRSRSAREQQVRAIQRKVDRLHALLESSGHQDLRQRLTREHNLFAESITDLESFEDHFQTIVDAYRSQSAELVKRQPVEYEDPEA